ncbi:MAG: hypothetical protein RIM84_11960 [Alphaproteobacteria bacterium]
MRSPTLALTLAAAALAGCQATAPADRTSVAPAAVSTQAADPGDQNGTGTMLAHVSPGQPSPQAGRALDGLDQTALRRHFGDPAMRRRDGQALVLAYRFDDCVLHLFLYPRTGDGDPRVRHAAAIGIDRQTRDAATCRP